MRWEPGPPVLYGRVAHATHRVATVSRECAKCHLDCSWKLRDQGGGRNEEVRREGGKPFLVRWTDIKTATVKGHACSSTYWSKERDHQRQKPLFFAEQMNLTAPNRIFSATCQGASSADWVTTELKNR